MTGIDYLQETWNPVTGCSGNGCKAHCWAREMVRRFPVNHEHEPLEYPGIGVPFDRVQFHQDRLDKPRHWRKPRRVGVCFTGDLFDEQVPLEWQNSVYVRMAKYDWHTYFVLTKQPQRLNEWINIGTGWRGMMPHVWHGVSVTDQEDADRMIPELLKVPEKKWVSVEPMLGPVQLDPAWLRCMGISKCDELKGGGGPISRGDKTWCAPPCPPRIAWVVVGCESGPKRRPCKPEWMIDVVRQCRAAGVPVYVKQVDMGKRVSHDPDDWPEELRVRERG